MKINSFQFLIPKFIRDKIRVLYQPILDRFILSEVKKFYAPYLEEGDLVYDVGAWRGVFTRAFVNLGCNVVAIEPQKDVFKYDNDNVIYLSCAISNKDRIERFYINKNNTQGSSLNRKWWNLGKYNKKLKVNVVTLDWLIKRHGIPKLIKIDVEGNEENVIKGLNQKIEFITFEFSKNEFDKVERILNMLECNNGEIECNISLSFATGMIFKEGVCKEHIVGYLKDNKTLKGDIHVRS